MFLEDRYSWTSGSCCISRRKVSPEIKALWLSDNIRDGIPLAAVRRHRHMMNDEVLRLVTTSKCTALVVVQTNRQM